MRCPLSNRFAIRSPPRKRATSATLGQLLSRLAIETQIPYTLVWSSFDRYREKIEGYYIIQVADQESVAINDYLSQQTIEWEALQTNGKC